MSDLNGKTALVTGGNSGIGYSSARKLKEMGATVIITGRNREALDKTALNSLTRTAASELAPRKIRVNSINPGPVNTAIFGKLGMPEEAIIEFAGAMQARIPLKQFGESDDIANLVGFLASDQASFITGSEYNIDGGTNLNPIL